jgi:hypothetical protein
VCGHTGTGGTLSLTSSLMAALSLGELVQLDSGAGVSSDHLSHDESILHKLPNVLACSITNYN